MKGSLGFHLTNTLELRKESERGSIFKYPAIRSCLEDLINQLRDFEKESCLLLKLADTGRIVVAVQHCLETTLTILKLQKSEENRLWRNAFQRERDEWMARIKLLLASGWRMKLEMGDKRQALEILTRLRYGVERYGDVMTPEEMDVISDVFDAVVHSSNAVVVENPGWFATSTHDWSSSKTSPVPGTDDQIYRDVNLWADLHHPHEFPNLRVRRPVEGAAWMCPWTGICTWLWSCSLLLSLSNVGVLSGLGLVRRSEVSQTSHLLKEQQPSPERDILTFGLIIFYLLSEKRNRSYRRLATNTPRPIHLPKQLPVDRLQSIEEEEWELLSLMCSPNSVNRIGIRDAIYRMELLADHENLKKAKTDTGKMEVVEDLRLFMVNTLGLTVEETLSEIELLCNDLPEFSAVNQPVLSRVKDVYFQLQTAVDPLSLDIVEKFSLILLRFLDSLDRRGFGAGSLVASVCASRTIANKNYSIHHNLDRLIQSTSQLQSGSSIHAWRPHFQEMQDLQRSTLQTFWENPLSTLGKLSDVDQREATALLEFEARNHSDEFSASGASHLSSSLPKWFIPSYQVKLGRHIADGSFGSVYEGKWLDTDVVVKLVMTDQRTAENRRQFLHEVDLWFSLSDEYLVKLYGACHIGLPFFVCERAIGGTLREYLQGRSMRKRWSCIYQAARGLQHLHDHGIIHGDLKGNNIVMGAFSVMLCDFGLASLASSSPKQLADTEINTLGAIQWKAPECLLGSAPTFASDIYSFGMCIIEIITGQYPWGPEMLDSVVKLKVVKEKRLPPRAEGIGDDAWSLIMHMCCFDPGQRVTIGTVASMAYDAIVFHATWRLRNDIYFGETQAVMPNIANVQASFQTHCHFLIRHSSNWDMDGKVIDRVLTCLGFESEHTELLLNLSRQRIWSPRN